PPPPPPAVGDHRGDRNDTGGSLLVGRHEVEGRQPTPVPQLTSELEPDRPRILRANAPTTGSDRVGFRARSSNRFEKGCAVSSELPYQDPSLPIAERVTDLLGRMTLPEKVGQMLQLNAKDGVDHLVTELHAGSILHASPESVRRAHELAAQTRLRIPLLVAEDCIHG